MEQYLQWSRQAPPRPLKVLLHDDESAPIPAIDVVERERQVRSGPDGAAAGGGHPGADGAAHSAVAAGHRSEEHTSELQSHLNLVCRLLLEKKNDLEAERLAVPERGRNVRRRH